MMETLNKIPPGHILRSRWGSQHSQASSSSTDVKIDSPTMTAVHAEADVLVNILLMLQKIDTKIENQKQRLEILETTSPTGSHDTTLFETSPLSRKQSMKKAAKGDVYVSESSDLKIDNANIYSRSILKMRLALDDALALADGERRFSLVDPNEVDGDDSISTSDVVLSDSDEEEALNEAGHELPASAPEPKEPDVYSLSAYTEDLMGSRMNVLYQTTVGTWNERLGLDDNIMPATPSPSSNHQQSSTVPSQSESHEKRKHPPRWIWVNVEEKRTLEKYKSAEMIFHAWHNLINGISEHFRRDVSLIKARKAEQGVLKPTYQVQTLVRRILDKMRSAVQREWAEERERMKALQSGL